MIFLVSPFPFFQFFVYFHWMEYLRLENGEGELRLTFPSSTLSVAYETKLVATCLPLGKPMIGIQHDKAPSYLAYTHAYSLRTLSKCLNLRVKLTPLAFRIQEIRSLCSRST